MAAPMDYASWNSDNDKFCVIEATVPTGFEQVAQREVEEKIGTNATELRGRIKFKCPRDIVHQVVELGCVDNCRIVMLYEPNFKFSDDKVENMKRLRNLVGSVNWPNGIQIWKKFFSFEHPVKEVPDVITTDFGEVFFPPPRQGTGCGKKTRKTKGNKWRKKKDMSGKGNDGQTEIREGTSDMVVACTEKGEATEENIAGGVKEAETKTEVNPIGEENNTVSNTAPGNGNTKDNSVDATCDENQAKKPRVRVNPWDPLKPSFRVTCNRNGDKHNFDSMTAAANFGGAIWQYFGWNVKMTEFDIEVILGIEDHEVTVSIGLTKESLHKRNITVFGPTTLRPTVAYSMLRLCDIQSGEVVCDPMCGSGSIPVQSGLSWPAAFNLCGDIGSRAIDRTRQNIDNLTAAHNEKQKPSLSVDMIRWDVTNLPLKESSVDVFITDLPFGVRMGHKVENWRLYPAALVEMARVARPESGRCCLLTEDKKCIIKTLQKMGKYWTRSKTLGVNIGGLAAGVFVLSRTKEKFIKGDNWALFASRGEGKKGPASQPSDSQDNLMS